MLVSGWPGGMVCRLIVSAKTTAHASIGRAGKWEYGVKPEHHRRAGVGKHPIYVLAADSHDDHRTNMFIRNVIKTVFCKVKRSSFYYLMIWNLPVRRASETQTGSDALGAVMVIVLLGGMVVLMRLYLTS